MTTIARSPWMPILVVSSACAGVRADEPNAASPPDPPSTQTAATAQPTTVALATRDDVASRMNESRATHAGLLELGPVSVVDRAWNAANDALDDALGLSFGLAYTLTMQAATAGPGDRSGAAGDLDLFGAWRVFGNEDEPNAGALRMNAQHIHTFGAAAPADIATDIGAVWGTSDGYGSAQSIALIQLYYEQWLFDDRVMLVIGKIDTTNYVGTNRYADDSLYFMNRAFSSNPALNYPENGLGVVVAGMLTDQLYIGGCIADANSVETQTGFNTIGSHDFFTAVEAGLMLNAEGLGEGVYRLTAWRSDRASEADIPMDFGFALSVDQELGNGVVPFFRYAWSDGDATGVSHIVAGGVAFEGPMGREDDVIGLGVSWGRPVDGAFDDQLAAEAFYRVQLASSIQWSFGAQIIVNATDPDSNRDDTIGVFAARLRFAF